MQLYCKGLLTTAGEDQIANKENGSYKECTATVENRQSPILISKSHLCKV